MKFVYLPDYGVKTLHIFYKFHKKKIEFIWIIKL